MFKITSLKLLKAIKYFIVNQQYKLIITRTSSDEVFLELISRKDFQVICILSKNYINKDEYKRDIERISSIFDRIKVKLMKLSIKPAIIYVGTNDFVKDQDVVNDIPVFKTSAKAVEPSVLENNFPTLFDSIESNGANDKEEFDKVMNEIKFFSEQKHKKSIMKRTTKFIDTHRLFVFALIAAHFAMFILAPKLSTFQPYSTVQLVNLFGASSFEMIFINNQFWRPFTSLFINPSLFKLGIDIFIFFSFGTAVWNMLGNKWYPVFILLSSYLTFFLSSLFIPGELLVGTEHLLELTLGAFIACYVLERVDFIKFYIGSARSNIFIFVIVIILAASSAMKGFMLFGVLSGFITAFMILSIKQSDIFNSLSAALSIAVALGLGAYFWKKIPVNNSGYLKLHRTAYTIFDDFYPSKSLEWKTNVCKYYDYKIPECKII